MSDNGGSQNGDEPKDIEESMKRKLEGCVEMQEDSKHLRGDNLSEPESSSNVTCLLFTSSALSLATAGVIMPEIALATVTIGMQDPPVVLKVPTKMPVLNNIVNTSIKMRIGNRLNLCAYHWLQQFKGKSASVGSTHEQFNAFWNGLRSAKQDLYNDKACRLVASSKWAKSEFERPLY
ncbi:hypothetical protein BS17DRAFT_765470 [Gyrodon lividus]|nr:hypothetical protein BS17DRAFT_765470 [Gyrodon lividus]